ncbi:MAG TPA: hypothetical protein PKN96_03805 [Flavobacterium sp.]|uniref:tetratricopeptide repeat protein n=1 Tax=Flavobacterium sp. TaxID=239 RepID=UPI002C663DC0|nr:hypothetical protein [Flavobacterium sp.]HNP32391.1 hypothetical protein [Flavobacterium sp.]
MKITVPIFMIITSFYSLGSLAQSSKHVLVNAKMENAEMLADNGLAVVSYHVEERINMRFGSNITTYDVSNIELINTNDLGENNVRIVTPKFAKVKVAPVKLDIEIPKLETLKSAIVTSSNLRRIDVIVPKKRRDYANIDIIETYERILDKGYKTVDMIKKVADSHFFDEDMELAAKWYGELFDLNPNLDTVYYFRYAQSLKAIGNTKKAEEMMKIFESKNL